MKSNFVFATAAVALIVVATCTADDGAKFYKKKCAGCHGATGEGKPAMNAPALAGTALDASQILDRITKGTPDSKAPHTKRISHLNDEHAKAVADYVKTLK